jgi:hypothetical protein
VVNRGKRNARRTSRAVKNSDRGLSYRTPDQTRKRDGVTGATHTVVISELLSVMMTKEREPLFG